MASSRQDMPDSSYNLPLSQSQYLFPAQPSPGPSSAPPSPGAESAACSAGNSFEEGLEPEFFEMRLTDVDKEFCHTPTSAITWQLQHLEARQVAHAPSDSRSHARRLSSSSSISDSSMSSQLDIAATLAKNVELWEEYRKLQTACGQLQAKIEQLRSLFFELMRESMLARSDYKP